MTQKQNSLILERLLLSMIENFIYWELYDFIDNNKYCRDLKMPKFQDPFFRSFYTIKQSLQRDFITQAYNLFFHPKHSLHYVDTTTDAEYTQLIAFIENQRHTITAHHPANIKLKELHKYEYTSDGNRLQTVGKKIFRVVTLEGAIDTLKGDLSKLTDDEICRMQIRVGENLLPLVGLGEKYSTLRDVDAENLTSFLRERCGNNTLFLTILVHPAEYDNGRFNNDKKHDNCQIVFELWIPIIEMLLDIYDRHYYPLHRLNNDRFKEKRSYFLFKETNIDNLIEEYSYFDNLIEEYSYFDNFTNSSCRENICNVLSMLKQSGINNFILDTEKDFI
jgi:hypothetical protein